MNKNIIYIVGAVALLGGGAFLFLKNIIEAFVSIRSNESILKKLSLLSIREVA
jgi:hypothetical protein